MRSTVHRRSKADVFSVDVWASRLCLPTVHSIALGGIDLTPAQKMRLRVLIRSLHLELERIDWDDCSAIELGELEFDIEFDHMPSGDENVVVWDQDHPDEIDSKEWPLCVECGNFLPSCVC